MVVVVVAVVVVVVEVEVEVVAVLVVEVEVEVVAVLVVEVEVEVVGWVDTAGTAFRLCLWWPDCRPGRLWRGALAPLHPCMHGDRGNATSRSQWRSCASCSCRDC